MQRENVNTHHFKAPEIPSVMLSDHIFNIVKNPIVIYWLIHSLIPHTWFLHTCDKENNRRDILYWNIKRCLK